MTAKSVPELARETLKQLIARKLPPTPGNYRIVFNEIAGLPDAVSFPEQELRRIALALPTKTPGQQKQRSLFEYAVTQRDWGGVQNALVAYGGFAPRAGADAAGPGASMPGDAPAADSTARGDRVGAPALTTEFLEQIARLIDFVRPALGADDSRFTEQTTELLAAMRQPGADVVRVKQMLGTFGHRASFAAEDQVEVKAMLLRLLRLMLENIGELSLDDRWLKGQVDALLSATTPPITLRRLDDVERKLRDVILKQTEAKGRALEAQEEMREMLRTFIARLSSMTDVTGAYGAEMTRQAQLIQQAQTLVELAPVLKQVVATTHDMARNSMSARDELQGMRQHAQTTAAEIAKLHQDLDRVSAQARHDPLTGALNRKGLDEAMAREVAQVRRKDLPLCIAMIDIDNFKKINDELGHGNGDGALAHLAQVARECLRPQDSVARYGGEEFVILLPDTQLDNGIEAMTRLQRELTRRFFLAGAQKVLITFSAGVAQVAAQEPSDATLKRADAAMYMAKRAGKNRVMGA